MSRILQLARCLSHPRELRMALSGLGVRISGDDRLGGLSAEETAGLVRWVRDAAARDADLTFVEIGTLFGFTARAVAATGVKVIAIDNFSWNPFGLTPPQHEAFTRRVLEGSGVELVNGDADAFLSSLGSAGPEASRTFVFLDGDHRYEAVAREISLCRAAGVKYLSGHDYGNEAFGVTRAVDELVGVPSEIAGSCWRR